MNIIEHSRCLMLETKDKRQFFTDEQNVNHLIEFATLFKSKISVVQVDQAELLDLKQLAIAVCNQDYQPPQPKEYSIIETINKKRNNLLQNAHKIKNEIKNKLLNGEIVELRTLTRLYNKISMSCICNHFTNVRKELTKIGFKIKKIGAGKYKIEKDC